MTVLLDPAHQPADDVATIAELAAAIRGCAARVVLVSPEVGLSLVPTTPLGRAFTDALGAANRAVADACDAVVLVVAGQPVWLKPAATATGPPRCPPAATAADGRAPARTGPSPSLADAEPTPEAAAARRADPARRRAGPDPRSRATAWAAPTMALPMVATGLVIQPGMELPMPDEYAGPQAVDRLATLDVPGAGLGVLERVVGFAAATQGTPTPGAWGSVRVLLLHGDHAGGAAAGTVAGESARRAAQARAGQGALARLAAESGAESPGGGRADLRADRGRAGARPPSRSSPRCATAGGWPSRPPTPAYSCWCWRRAAPAPRRPPRRCSRRRRARSRPPCSAG